jgi:hypothetical protein
MRVQTCPCAFGAQAREHVQRILAEVHAVVLERGGPVVALLVPAEHPIGLGDAHHLRHAGQHLHLLDRQRAGVADEVDLGQRHFAADFAVDAELDIGQPLQLAGEEPVVGTFGAGVGVEDEDHREAIPAIFQGIKALYARAGRCARPRAAPHQSHARNSASAAAAEFVASAVGLALDSKQPLLLSPYFRGTPR